MLLQVLYLCYSAVAHHMLPHFCCCVLLQVLYFTYMAMVSYGFFCLTGTIGFVACYWFVRQIYGALKID